MNFKSASLLTLHIPYERGDKARDNYPAALTFGELVSTLGAQIHIYFHDFPVVHSVCVAIGENSSGFVHAHICIYLSLVGRANKMKCATRRAGSVMHKDTCYSLPAGRSTCPISSLLKVVLLRRIVGRFVATDYQIY
jgi:hypothetical protein